jgi:sulfate adenylyltransferase subunit 1
LLYDSKSIFEDQLAAVAKTSSKKGFEGIDLSLLTDGLSAEREQGITIDVAYRYFSTPKRKFIIADTPGHEQYTRNMVTGASTAQLTIILIDARKGILNQSRRHALISSLLGIPNFVVAVNKMDLVDYSQSVFENIVAEFKTLISKLDIDESRVTYIPISALQGDNVVNASNNMPWYDDLSIIQVLENIDVQSFAIGDRDFRLPVQYVIRADTKDNPDFRGFAGQIASGSIALGDRVVSLPSGLESKVKSIKKFDQFLSTAIAGESISLVFEDEIDTSRGDMICKLGQEAKLLKEFSANICWMSEDKFDLNKKYLLKHTSNKVKAMPVKINYRLNINSYQQEAAQDLLLNDIANVSFKVLKPLCLDLYAVNRITGSFVLIDELHNNTVAAGMLTGF